MIEIPLAELMAQRVPSVDPTKFCAEHFTLWSIPSFDVGRPESAIGSEIGSTKKLVQDGDVLLSKIVPHIRRAWIVRPRDRNRQIASSEWIVFRDQRFLPDFIRHFLVSDGFHERFMATVTGVGGSLLRAQPKEVAKILIPLPPLDEQQRIVGLLDRAGEIKRRGDAARTKVRATIAALFNDTFGDPTNNPKGWPIVEIGEIVSRIDSGWSPICGDGPPTDDQWGVLKLSAVKSGGFDAKEAKLLPNNSDARPELAVRNGDLLFTRKNTLDLVGTAAVVTGAPQRRMLPDTVFRLVPSSPASWHPEYLCSLINLSIFRPAIQQLASGSAASMPGISKGRLQGLRIPLPPLEAQAAFADQIVRIGSLVSQLSGVVSKAELVSAALSGEVFG